MHKHLIVFLGCPECDSDPVLHIFRRLGMVSDVANSDDDAASSVGHLNQRLHTATYGFPECAADLRLAGEILRNRQPLLPELRQIPDEWVRDGIRYIQSLTESAEFAGFLHSGTVLFHEYWHHVLSHFPEIRVHTVMLLHTPEEQAMRLTRSRPSLPVQELFEFLAAYYLRFLQVRRSRPGSIGLIRLHDPAYASDLMDVLGRCGLKMDDAMRSGITIPPSVRVDFSAEDHPISGFYHQLLESFDVS